MSLVLASTSPRRKDLLALLGVPFEVVEQDFEEDLRAPGLPEELAARFARGKAESCARRRPEALVIGSDTLIACEGALLGKPRDLEEAGAMLRRLRGRPHAIHTGVALRRLADGVDAVEVETVRVWMREFADGELEAYLRTGESLGKAGAYSIQGRGARLIERIEGDYPAAVGLPLRRLAAMLRRHGVAVPADVEALYTTRPYPNWARFIP